MIAPLVEVTWFDSCSHHAWYKNDEIDDCQLVRMTTVGYMVRRNKKNITLAQGRSYHEARSNDKWSEIWVIPAESVTRIRRLR